MKRGMLMAKYGVTTVALLLIAIVCGTSSADNVYMTKEQLLPLLGKSDLIVIDIRTNYYWDKSDIKIKGALREEPMRFSSWMKKYPKDKTIVLYCS